MSKEDRYNQILEILRTRNNVTVNYLAKKLFVSPSTIRRDYQVLQSRGLLHHTYGKATLNFGEALGLPIELRRRNMPAEKLKIGKKAVELVKDGDIIYIDASSTALCMVEHLEKFNYLTVITNGLNTLRQLEYFNKITVYSLGGLLTNNSMAFTGQLANENLSHLHIDKCFFSVGGNYGFPILNQALQRRRNIFIHKFLFSSAGYCNNLIPVCNTHNISYGLC